MPLYLVGSRFFGCHREDSDYDFIGEDTPENHEICLKAGLSRVEGSEWTQYWRADGIDVVLHKDIEFYLKVREFLGSLPDMKFVSKDERNRRLRWAKEYFKESAHAPRKQLV